MKLNDHPYLNASRITLTEEYEVVQRTDPSERVYYTKEWTASIASSCYATVYGLKNYGPRVEATRKGKSAEEAYTALVEALTEQGWIVE